MYSETTPIDEDRASRKHTKLLQAKKVLGSLSIQPEAVQFYAKLITALTSSPLRPILSATSSPFESHNMFKWIKSFLQDRSANVLLDGRKSVSVKIREGVPQGDVISPVLFLTYINDINRPSYLMSQTPFTQMTLLSGAPQNIYPQQLTESSKL